LLDSLPIEKAPWATYTLGDDLETLLVAYALGIERIEHMDVIEHDPLLRIKLDLDKLPHKTSLYRALDRFSSSVGLLSHNVYTRSIPYPTCA
jgi:hypothetical protein